MTNVIFNSGFIGLLIWCRQYGILMRGAIKNYESPKSLNKMHKIKKAYIVFGGIFISLSGLTGCNVTTPDRNAVLVRFCFPDPQQYPFLSLENMRKGTGEENDPVSEFSVDGLSISQKQKLLKDGYEEKYKLNAKIYLFSLSKKNSRWMPIPTYNISYIFPGEYFIPEKKEYYGSTEIKNTEEVLIILSPENNPFTIKVLIIPNNKNIAPRFCIMHLDSSQASVQRYGMKKYFLIFDYTLNFPEFSIVLPQWDSWTIL